MDAQTQAPEVPSWLRRQWANGLEEKWGRLQAAGAAGVGAEELGVADALALDRAGLAKVRFDEAAGEQRVYPTGQSPPPPAPGHAAARPAAAGSVSRHEAADRFEEALNAAGFRARAWSDGDAVRVYVSDSKGRGLGYLAITYEGTIESAINRHRGAVRGALPDLNITPLARKQGLPARRPEPPDDPLERMEWEATWGQHPTGELPGA